MHEYEKLGAFYLGRRAEDRGLLLYDSKDLVTHAVCVGMTGSGKTGLCISLLEEAAIDGIPALLIDPKGDLANLLLTFPSLDAASFEPWVNPDEARTKGLSTPEFAAQQAEVWKNGLAKWDQGGERIARLKAAADFAIYTPGSDAGLPVSVLSSFKVPSEAERADREVLRDRISATAAGLLALAGIEAEAMQSREHVLISALLDNAWRQGQSLDLASLIAQVQTPPLSKVGVMDIDSFYPAKDRFTLAMTLNGLLASPGFEAWMQGDPLDVGRFLYSPEGKPRIAILSIAHLSDSERMFFVSLLLNEVLVWTRRQTGTTSLRAIVYMDEIFGYFPPVANPPSKKPLLTLLKQARAFGVGVVLATQNPVDLDYKGLANTGTWFIGRLQTERDKARVLEGLEGAAAAAGGQFDRGRMEQTLAGLGNRVFLMNNVHEDQPVLFETRWCLSYLRGPLSRPQIRQLMDSARVSAAAKPETATRRPATAGSLAPPVLPPGIPQWFVPVRGGGEIHYQPRIVGVADVHFIDDKRGVDEQRELVFLAPIGHEATGVDWSQAEESAEHISDFDKQPAEGATFAELPAVAAKAAKYAVWEKSFATWIFQSQCVTLHRSSEWKQTSKPGESVGEFRVRLAQLARERRDAEVEKLRAKLAPKVAVLEERKRRALQALEKERQQAASQKTQSMLDIGTSILGAFLGRKGSAIGKVSSAAKSYGRISKESADVGRAQETAEAVDRQLQDLNAELEAQAAVLAAPTDPSSIAVEELTIRPKKANIVVKHVGLAWTAFATAAETR